MSEDERKALAFVGLLLGLSVAARMFAAQPEPLTDAPAAEVAALLQHDSALQSRQREAERPLDSGDKVDLNTASETQLQRLPGVGAATARAIVAYRDSAGGFRSADDLLRIRGIGPAKLAAMRPHVETSARATTSTARRRFRPYAAPPSRRRGAGCRSCGSCGSCRRCRSRRKPVDQAQHLPLVSNSPPPQEDQLRTTSSQ